MEEHIRRPFSLKRRIVRTSAWLIRAKVTRGAAVAIYRPDGTLLLVKSRARDSSKWGLPGGFSKAAESSLTTAIREVEEETGLQLPIQQAQEVAHYIQPWAWHLDVLYRFILEQDVDDSQLALRGRPRSLEIKDACWADIDDPTDMQSIHLTDETTLALSVMKRDDNPGIRALQFLYYYDGRNHHHNEDGYERREGRS